MPGGARGLPGAPGGRPRPNGTRSFGASFRPPDRRHVSLCARGGPTARRDAPAPGPERCLRTALQRPCRSRGALTKMLNRLAAFILIAAAGAHAQVASAVLMGQVSDESGAAASGSKVTAQQDSTGFSRTVTAGTDGAYRIDDLPPGRYSV